MKRKKQSKFLKKRKGRPLVAACAASVLLLMVTELWAYSISGPFWLRELRITYNKGIDNQNEAVSTVMLPTHKRETTPWLPESQLREPETSEPVMPDTEQTVEYLPQLAQLHEQNPDLVGWIKIEGTKLNYPLMYTPQDPEKYLHMNFDGNYSYGGLPFLNADCSLSPESGNLIIHGHNMKNGTMFKTLFNYVYRHYWEDYPVISLDLLDEERTYEILSVFYDRIYYANEDCFKFYQFIDTSDEAEFREAVDYYKTNSLYDTGITPQYGDRLLTLVTCSYHLDNGRFVVVARLKQP